MLWKATLPALVLGRKVTIRPEGNRLMSTSRRDLLKLAGAGAASAALAAAGFVWAQVKEEADNEPVTIVRKGIDKAIEVINVDLLEAEAKTRLTEGVYVFIAHGAGEQWTLRENRRAFGDYVFTPHRMGGIVRDTIDTSITMLGEKLGSVPVTCETLIGVHTRSVSI